MAPGPVHRRRPAVSPRWAGSGWTIFDNKGRPVRSYEPFFSATPGFEFAAQTGVSTVTCYDPPGRVVATLHPDSTLGEDHRSARGEQDVGRRRHRAGGRPAHRRRRRCATSPRLLGAGPFTSWYDLRSGGSTARRRRTQAAQQDAARKAAAARRHARRHPPRLARPGLPGGRRQRRRRPGTRSAPPTTPQGTPLAVFDAARPARGGVRATATRSRRRDPATWPARDMAGPPALPGQRGRRRAARRCPTSTGQPIRSWDARGHAFRLGLRRGAAADAPLRQHRRRRRDPASSLSVYGEGQAAANLCGRLFRRYDMAGYAENSPYDFKGNLVAGVRQLAADYHAGGRLDAAGRPDHRRRARRRRDRGRAGAGRRRRPGPVREHRAFDALNRPVQLVTPHSAAMRPDVHPARLRRGRAAHARSTSGCSRPPRRPRCSTRPRAGLHAVTGIAYNARGQRLSIGYGNGTASAYGYDPQTFRLTAPHHHPARPRSPPASRRSRTCPTTTTRSGTSPGSATTPTPRT